MISFLPVTPKEKFLLKIIYIPSIRKLKIGIINNIATRKDIISKGFKSDNIFLMYLVEIFKNQ